MSLKLLRYIKQIISKYDMVCKDGKSTDKECMFDYMHIKYL